MLYKFNQKKRHGRGYNKKTLKIGMIEIFADLNKQQSQVPTMAIDRIEISNNTSIVFDEMLSHRLGQIPIKVDPDKFDFRTHGLNF